MLTCEGGTSLDPQGSYPRYEQQQQSQIQTTVPSWVAAELPRRQQEYRSGKDPGSYLGREKTVGNDSH